MQPLDRFERQLRLHSMVALHALPRESSAMAKLDELACAHGVQYKSRTEVTKCSVSVRRGVPPQNLKPATRARRAAAPLPAHACQCEDLENAQVAYQKPIQKGNRKQVNQAGRTGHRRTRVRVCARVCVCVCECAGGGRVCARKLVCARKKTAEFFGTKLLPTAVGERLGRTGGDTRDTAPRA